MDSETTSNSESTGVDNGQKLSVKLVEFRQQLVASRRIKLEKLAKLQSHTNSDKNLVEN